MKSQRAKKERGVFKVHGAELATVLCTFTEIVICRVEIIGIRFGNLQMVATDR
jgi:hypothetical protein